MDEELENGSDPKAVGVQERLDWIRSKYGLVPLVVEEMAKEPETFIPYFDFTRNTTFEPKHLDKKIVELAIISAGSALASEHCLGIHLEQARESGATKEEIREALLIGAYMAFVKSQSISFRMFQKMSLTSK